MSVSKVRSAAISGAIGGYAPLDSGLLIPIAYIPTGTGPTTVQKGTLLEQHTATSSATLDFTAFISSTYDEYKFELIDVLPATNAQQLFMRVSIGGSFSSSALYTYGYWVYINGGSTTGGGATQTSFGTSNANDVNNSAGMGAVGYVTLYDPASSKAYKKVSWQIGWIEGTPTPKTSIATAYYNSTSALDGFRFLFGSGNIASGTIRVYGVNK